MCVQRQGTGGYGSEAWLDFVKIGLLKADEHGAAHKILLLPVDIDT